MKDRKLDLLILWLVAAYLNWRKTLTWKEAKWWTRFTKGPAFRIYTRILQEEEQCQQRNASL